MISFERMERSAWKPEYFTDMKVKNLYDFVMSKFPTEAKLKL